MQILTFVMNIFIVQCTYYFCNAYFYSVMQIVTFVMYIFIVQCKFLLL